MALLLRRRLAGGVGLYLEKGRPTYLYNATARPSDRFQVAGEPLAPGAHEVVIRVVADPSAGPRAARLSMIVDGREAGAQAIQTYYPARGGGVVGRYNVRTLLADVDWPNPHGLAVGDVRFRQQAR